MSLIRCWECDREISSAATQCPHCGAPSKYKEVEVTKPIEEIEKDSTLLVNIIGYIFICIVCILIFLPSTYFNFPINFFGGIGEFQIIMLFFASLLIYCFMTKKYIFAIFTATLAGSLMLYNIYRIEQIMKVYKRRPFEESINYDSGDFFTDLFFNGLMHYGPIFFLLSIVMIIGAATWAQWLKRTQQDIDKNKSYTK